MTASTPVLAALGDDVGRAELAGDLLARLVARHRDDALGAELRGGEDAAEADRAVADDDGGAARAHAATATAACQPVGHDVGEGEQRREQRVVGHRRRS